MPYEPTPIVVVSWGAKWRKQHDFILEKVECCEAPWHLTDLLKELTELDRDHSVKFEVDGRDPEVTRAIYAQRQFPAVMIAQLQRIIAAQEAGTDASLNGVHCWSGYHRAWVDGCSLASFLNMLVWSDGSRRFNCLHLPLHDTKDTKKIFANLRNAVEYTQTPWTVAEGGCSRPMSEVYGYTACMSAPKPARNFQEILGFINFVNDSQKTVIDAVVAAAVPEVGAAEVDEVASMTWGARGELGVSTSHVVQPLSGDSGSASSGGIGSTSASSIAAPTPPPPPPPVRERLPQQPSGPPPPKMRKTTDDSTRDTDSAVRGPPIAWGVPFDPVNWKEVLTQLEVGVEAQLQLALLSQLSQEGNIKANNIVYQLIDGKAKRPSAFVYKSIQNARRDLKVLG